MEKLRPGLLRLLSNEFAGDNPKRGFSFDEIINFFQKYDILINKENYKKFRPTRREFFENCLGSLPPVHQFNAVMELLLNPPSTRYPLPKEEKMTELKKRIFAIWDLTPVSDEIASLNLPTLIKDWYKVVSRIHESPASSITASRTMLENLYTWVLEQNNITQTDLKNIKGDLGKLHKTVCKVLKIDEWANKIISGLSSIIYGIAEMSNVAGDRHAGNYESVTFEMAEFIAYIAGSICIFIYKIFLLKK